MRQDRKRNGHGHYRLPVVVVPRWPILSLIGPPAWDGLILRGIDPGSWHDVRLVSVTAVIFQELEEMTSLSFCSNDQRAM